MRRFGFTALAILSVALASCASLAPAPVPESAAAADLAPDPADAAFWSSFGSPLLATLVQQAAAESPDLLIAIQRRLIADDAVRLADAQRGPSLGFHVGPVDSTASTLASGSRQQSAVYALGFEASYELDLRGRLAQLSRAARADARASRDDVDAMRIATRCLVAQGVFDLAQADQMLALQQQRLALAEQQLQLQTLRAGAGRVTASALGEAQARQADAHEALTRWRVQRHAAIAQLAALLGKSADSLQLSPDVMPASLHLPDVPAGLSSSLLQRRPDVRAAAARLEAAGARDEAERASRFPQIRLTASLGVATDLLHRAARGAIGLFGFGPSLDLPIYDGGALKAQLDTRDRELEIARLEYRKAGIAAFSDVEQALQLRAAADERCRDAVLGVQRSEAERRAVTLEVGAGRKSRLDVIETDGRRLDAEQALLDSRHAQLDSTLALVQALGGVWQTS